MFKKRKKIGLALGSGGAKGLVHIGVLKALEKHNIPIDFISGASIGALIGAHYALHKDVAEIERIALSTNWKTAFKIYDPSFKGGFVKGDKVENLFNDWFKSAKFKELKIPMTVIATDLLSGEEVKIVDGDLTKAIRASISVPLVFNPLKYYDYLLVDGGLSNPLPDDIARKMGSDVVLAVNLDNKNFDNIVKNGSIPISKMSIRALNIIRYHFAKQSGRYSDIIIEPEAGEIGLIGWKNFFDVKVIKKLIKSGEDEVEKNIKQINKLIK